MSQQPASSLETSSLMEIELKDELSRFPQRGSAVQRLAAIWALRLVLETDCGALLLRVRQRADDLLTVIGPWVDWPDETIRRFEQHMRPKFAMDELTPFQQIVERSRGEMSWQPADWSDLADPFCAYASAQPNPLRNLLRTSLIHLERPPADARDPLLRNLGLLSDLLCLSEADRALLSLGAVMQEYRPLAQLLGACRYEGMNKAAAVLGAMLDISPGRVLTGLRKSGPLRRSGLIETSHHLSDLEDLFSLSRRLMEVIGYPHPSLDSLMQGFIRESAKGQLEAADYPHLAAQLADLGRLLGAALREHRAGVNLLLYGDPGTGKTEFAKLLADLIGARLFEVCSSDEEGDAANVQERMLGYRLAQSFLGERQDAVLLFDEVEPVLSGDGMALLARALGAEMSAASKGKAWINQTLETNPVPAIWIANDIGSFDPAYLRRFFYVIEFKVPPRSVRRRIVRRHLDTLDLGPAFLDRLADFETVSPAQFGQVSQLLQLMRPDTREEREELLSRALEAGMAAMGQRKSENRRDVVTGYSLEFLNVESRFPIQRIIRAAHSTSRLSLCLFGPPGTGKSQLAHYLAEQLDRPLIARRASDLLDKWVGGSEQKIRNMFREARDEHAVLLLDEADSLLRDRADATKSWEVTQVNELLQQMEVFDGLFVCATNRFENLDPAALRRFSFKLRFDYLTPEQRRRLFLQETDSSEREFNSELRNRLDRLDTLTPGDFATVQRQCRALGETLGPEGFLDQLEEEIRLKDVHHHARPIGFVR